MAVVLAESLRRWAPAGSQIIAAIPFGGARWEPPEPDTMDVLESLDISRFDYEVATTSKPHGPCNIGALRAPFDADRLVFLSTDMILMAPFQDCAAFDAPIAAKPAHLNSWSDEPEYWRQPFDAAGERFPEHRVRTTVTGEVIPPYFERDMLVLRHPSILADEWTRCARALEQVNIHPSTFGKSTDNVSLAVAIAACGGTVGEVGEAYNFPADVRPVPPGSNAIVCSYASPQTIAGDHVLRAAIRSSAATDAIAKTLRRHPAWRKLLDDSARPRRLDGVHRATCILGMGRSGTSMTARALNLLGLRLGEESEMLPAAPSNVAGHWEHGRFVDLNDRILALLGSAFDLPPGGEIDWNELVERDAELAVDAAAVLQRLAHHDPWGWKDPRTTHTLPYWEQLLGEAPRVVACLRDPVEVAMSLRKRDNTSLALGMDLWRKYNEAILRYAADRVIWVHYQALLADPSSELQRIRDALGLHAAEGALERAAASIHVELWNQRISASERSRISVPRPVQDLYERLLPLAGVEPSEVLNSEDAPWRFELAPFARSTDPAALIRELEVYQLRVSALGHEVALLENHIQRMNRDSATSRQKAEDHALNLATTTSDLAEARAALAALEITAAQQVDAAEAALADALTKAANAEAMLRGMISSRSWRLTRPLRRSERSPRGVHAPRDDR